MWKQKCFPFLPLGQFPRPTIRTTSSNCWSSSGLHLLDKAKGKKEKRKQKSANKNIKKMNKNLALNCFNRKTFAPFYRYRTAIIIKSLVLESYGGSEVDGEPWVTNLVSSCGSLCNTVHGFNPLTVVFKTWRNVIFSHKVKWFWLQPRLSKWLLPLLTTVLSSSTLPLTIQQHYQRIGT